MRRPSSDATTADARKWHAVEVACPREVCAAARAIAGQRFLANEAPLLPLSDCDRRDDCECRYRHHGDRRSGPRRAAEGAPPNAPNGEQANRRQAEGRRAEDRPQWDDDEPAAGDLDDTYYEYVNRSKLGS